jgi:protein-tyrosine-phosphatase/predicted ATP-grasp superfamily ATP-dependent carboligase
VVEEETKESIAHDSSCPLLRYEVRNYMTITQPESERILVLTNGRSMATLPVVRSMGRHGLDVVLATITANTLAAQSRYVRQVVLMPDPSRNMMRWLEWFRAFVVKNQFAAVFPISDDVILPLILHSKEIAPHPLLLIPGERESSLSYDKENTILAAKELNVPHPQTVVWRRPEDGRAILDEFHREFPIILKPAFSRVVRENRIRPLAVERAYDQTDFEQKGMKILAYCPVLVQKMHRGRGIGQEFLMKNGEIVAEFQHRREHEPLRGGGGSYRSSMMVDPDLRKESLKLLQSVKWSGIAMVEYLLESTPSADRPLLMEINGRLWGSLPLPLAAGVDFPWLWLQLAQGREPPPPQKYKVPVYCRNCARDIRWIRENRKADHKDPTLHTLALWRQASEIGHLLAGREHFDELTLDDPRPGLRLLSSLWRRAWRKAALALLRLPMMNGWYVKRSARRLKKAGRIVVLCKGNTCRSPFLAEYLRQRAAQLSLRLASVRSCGLLQHDGTPSSALAVQAAKPFAVDLSAHAAKSLCHEKPKFGDVYVLVEPGHAEELSAWHGKPRPKVIYWGLLDAKLRSPLIQDPGETDAVTYQSVYEQIQRACERILREIRRIEGK